MPQFQIKVDGVATSLVNADSKAEAERKATQALRKLTAGLHAPLGKITAEPVPHRIKSVKHVR